MKPAANLDPVAQEMVGQINASYAEFVALGTQANEAIVSWVNAGRAVGLYLESLKAKRRDWHLLLVRDMAAIAKPEEVRLTEKHAKGFQRLISRLKAAAQTVADALSSVKDCEILAGVMEFTSGHGRQKIHVHDPVSDLVKIQMQLSAVWNRSIKNEVRKWTDERRQQLRDQLMPVQAMIDALE